MEMLEDLDKETVDFRPNYDESRVEPMVLPGRFPNLLINGGSGIAVAMASSIPPHNPSEVANAIIAYLDDPEIDVARTDGAHARAGLPDRRADLRPTGDPRGLHHGPRHPRDARARREIIEKPTRAASEIIITEIPYQVNTSDAAQEDRRSGQERPHPGHRRHPRRVLQGRTRSSSGCKRGEDPEIVLNQLYKFTPLRDSFSVIMIALVDGRPELCSLKRLIEEYVRHRKEVITRRTQYLLRKAEERDHLVAGLIKALDLIDEIVALIRAQRGPQGGQGGLIARFEFSTPQAEAILQMRLQRLTGLQRQELEQEHDGAAGEDHASTGASSRDEENVIRDHPRGHGAPEGALRRRAPHPDRGRAGRVHHARPRRRPRTSS